MKKKICIVMMVSCMILTATACGRKDSVQDVPESTMESTIQANPTESMVSESQTAAGTAAAEASMNDKKEVSLDDLSKMLGKTDEEAKDLLGGGTENKAIDNALLIGRDYESALFGKNAVIHTMYDDNGKIDMVQAELADFDISDCQKALSEATGTTMEEIDNGESGQSRGQWSNDGQLIRLYQVENTSTITIELQVPAK